MQQLITIWIYLFANTVLVGEHVELQENEYKTIYIFIHKQTKNQTKLHALSFILSHFIDIVYF